jgi:hypothetical protein
MEGVRGEYASSGDGTRGSVYFLLESSHNFDGVHTAGEGFGEHATHQALHLAFKAVEKAHYFPSGRVFGRVVMLAGQGCQRLAPGPKPRASPVVLSAG